MEVPVSVDPTWIGKVASCSIGRIGLVTGVTTAPWGETLYGVGLDGKGLWMSRRPVELYPSIAAYADALLALPVTDQQVSIA